jgi:hypothetical protein
MKDLHKAAESLAVGMSRVLREWVNSCLLGSLIIAILMAATAFYVILSKFTAVYATVAGAF